MEKVQVSEKYAPEEEKWNVITHGLGLVMSLFGFYLLLKRAAEFSNLRLTIGLGIYGLSLVLLYSASTLYHRSRNPVQRYRFKILDHISIFFLIAGSYTPFSLITLKGSTGNAMLYIAWGIALVGTMLKIFFTGRFKLISTLLYVGMGWIIIFAIEPMIEHLSRAGLWWLFSGGLSYTLGAIIYNLSRISLNHAIFHCFVLIGSFCHFMSIYIHVVP